MYIDTHTDILDHPTKVNELFLCLALIIFRINLYSTQNFISGQNLNLATLHIINVYKLAFGGSASPLPHNLKHLLIPPHPPSLFNIGVRLIA